MPSCRPDRARDRTVSEGRQRPFGGVGFGGFERDVVHLARRCAAAFTGAMAFPNDGCAVCMNGDPDPGEVDRQECAPIFAGKDATGFDGLPVPAVKPKDPVGFRNRVPALQIGELPAIGLTGADKPVIGLAPQRADLFC